MDLSRIRDAWPILEAEKTRLLREMSVAESLRVYAMLYEAFAGRLGAEEEKYREEREAAVLDRQRKLVRLATWLGSPS